MPAEFQGNHFELDGEAHSIVNFAEVMLDTILRSFSSIPLRSHSVELEACLLEHTTLT